MLKILSDLIKKNDKYIPKINIKIYDIEKNLKFLGIELSENLWSGFCITIMLILFTISFSFGFNYGMIFSIIFGVYLYYLPLLKKKEVERRIEEELPLFLKNLGILLSIGVEFKQSLLISSKTTPAIREELKKINRNIRLGAGMANSISNSIKDFDSNKIKRAFAQILNAYETGNGEQIKTFGEELMNLQKYKIKEYGARLSIISLLFIMVAVIGPVFYMISSIIKPFAFGGEVGNPLIYLMVLFPLASISILLTAKILIPPSIFREKEENFGILMLGVANSIIFLQEINLIYKIILIVLSSVGFYLYSKKDVEVEIKKEEVEKNIAEALLIMASLPKSTTLKGIIKRIAGSKIKGVSEEFKKAENQLKANISVDKIMEDLKGSMKSNLFDRVIDVLEYSIKTGVSVNKRMGELADDILSYLEIERERSAMLNTQKYTMMLGVILTGIVIGKIYSLVNEIGGSAQEYMVNIVPAYLVLNSGIVSWFCSSIERRKSRAIIYFFLLSSISIIIFFYIIGYHVSF